jgi:endo-1,4-beta-xylanase
MKRNLLILIFVLCAACVPRAEYTAESVSEGLSDAILFETGRFTARGSGTISQAGDSVKITGRTASWNGIAVDVTDIAEPFGEYEFSMLVMPSDESGETVFQLSAEFILGNAPTWRHFNGANVRASSGEWTQIRGVLPFYGFDSVTVFIETDEFGAAADFSVRDVMFRSIKQEYEFDDTLPRLYEIYEDYFLLGTAVVPRDLRGTRLDFVRHHFNALTAGNDMKPDALQNRPGIFTFNTADMIVKEAIDSGMSMVGHTLVWHSQSPSWKNYQGISREEAILNLEMHITEVVSRYKGQISVWDAVNEAFPSYVPADADHSDWKSLLRDTPWLNAIGYDYIEIAFRAAHKADPNAKLIYNDYNLDSEGKREAVFHMLKELLERGVPVHGVGMQAHYDLTTKPSDVEDSILRFAQLGISVSITELDISVQGAHETMPAHLELAQAVLYARLFNIFKEHSDVIHRVTLWGLDDATSWRSDRFPLAFNRGLSPKTAFCAIIDPDGFLAYYIQS